ncbi:MAG: hypothetical protein MJY74_04580 [Bacteroidaceae bacterium]|nr:hypothetical protein [Bacteroidaceae bacterium]
MGQGKQELIHLLNFVKQVYSDPENKEFIAGLQATVLEGDLDIKKDINEIREALQLRGKNSLDYSFVKDEYVRNQLLVDNLRMENVALNLTISDDERFHSFCINAFLQVENIMNYYYSVRYSNDISSVLYDIEYNTQADKYPYRRNGREVNIGDIPIYNKLSAFCNQYFPFDPKAGIYDYTSKNLQTLREIRNDNFHRGGMKENLQDVKYQTESDYRRTLIRFVNKIEEILKNNI